MPGFFDRINEASCKNFTTNNCLNDNSTEFDFFSFKPSDSNSKLEGKKIWEEKCDFGFNQKYQPSLIETPSINDLMTPMEFVKSGSVMHASEKQSGISFIILVKKNCFLKFLSIFNF